MKEELLKLIKENPDLDVVVMADTQELTYDYGYLLLEKIKAYDYGYLLLEKIKAEVTDIYNSPDDETIYFDKEDIVEELRNYLADNEEYANMSDEEYDKMCEEKAKDYFYKKAIVVWGSN